jgi:DNA-directed RNA polymerase specialized sigma subunit
MKKSASLHYIDNKEFLEELIKYFELKRIDKNTQIPDPIVKKFFLIAEKILTQCNFSGYSFKDDMVQDALIHCIKYMKNFDADKSNNPFAFFTTLIINSFLQTLHKEKKANELRKRLNVVAEEYFRKLYPNNLKER